MTHIRKNVLANAANNIWLMLLFFLVAPKFKILLGDDGFALVGIFFLFQLLCTPLDAGLRTTISRELARLRSLDNTQQESRNIVHTLEWIYLAVALLIGVVFASMAPWIANVWLGAMNLSSQQVIWSLVAMAFALSAQWPFHLYAGGLTGLEHIQSLSFINIIMYTLRYLGALVILKTVSTSPVIFFLWQGIVGLIHSGTARLFLVRYLAKSDRPARFHMDSFRRIRRFTMGMTGMVITGILLSQMDRIILSNGRIASVATFASYTLALIAVSFLPRLVEPFRQSLSPRFVRLVTENNRTELIRLYHRGSQWVSVVVLVPAIVLAFFPKEFIWIWTQDTHDVQQTGPLLCGLVIATALPILMSLPTGLQIAYGWTRLLVMTNVVSLLIVPGVMLFAAIHYSTFGVIWTIVIWRGVSMLLMIPLMHRRILPGEQWRWFGIDILLPAGGVLLVSAIGWWCNPHWESRWLSALWLILVLIFAGTTALMLCPETRKSTLHILFRKKTHP